MLLELKLHVEPSQISLNIVFRYFDDRISNTRNVPYALTFDSGLSWVAVLIDSCLYSSLLLDIVLLLQYDINISYSIIKSYHYRHAHA